MGDRLETPDAAGVGSDIDAALEAIEQSTIPPPQLVLVVGCADVYLKYSISKKHIPNTSEKKG